jgi:hypothetical protein
VAGSAGPSGTGQATVGQGTVDQGSTSSTTGTATPSALGGAPAAQRAPLGPVDPSAATTTAAPSGTSYEPTSQPLVDRGDPTALERAARGTISRGDDRDFRPDPTPPVVSWSQLERRLRPAPDDWAWVDQPMAGQPEQPDALQGLTPDQERNALRSGWR